MLPKAASICEIHDENYRTKTFVLDVSLDAYPGQFIMAWLPRFDEKPFSLVNADPLTLMITAVGPFSRLLHELQVGDRLWIRGPLGQGFHIPMEQQHLLLVGGGYGVAPLFWLTRTQIDRVATIDVIIGARTAIDLLYIDHFRQLVKDQPTDGANHATLTLHLTTEDGTTLNDNVAVTRGRVTDIAEPLASNDAIDSIYACGPHGMLAALQTLGARHEISCQLSWEAYMRCGVGLCGACEHEGRVLCLDGPVLVS